MKRLALGTLTILFIGCLVVASPASAQYNPMYCTINPTVVERGGSFNVSAGYFQPGSQIEVRIESDPIVLGTLVAQSDGTVNGDLVVPLGVEVGSHIVYAKGSRIGTGVVEEVSATISVIDATAAANAAAATTTPPSDTTGSLPITGASIGILLAVAAFLLAAGGIFVTAKRKRDAAKV